MGKENKFKLFYYTVKRMGDLVGVFLLVAAILFGARIFL
jgi:hypothetical protein